MRSPTVSATSDLSSAAGQQTLADGCLVLSHRLSEWMSKAPTMEEDIALGNIALDLLGQARGLLSHIGDQVGVSEDQLAYFRDPADFRNPLICELPNGDYGHTILRQLFVDCWLAQVWPVLAATAPDEVVRGVAEKAVKENAYHLRHSSAWVVRLGDGTDESRRRMVAALDALWPYRGELAVDGWYDRVESVLTEATLPLPARDAWTQRTSSDGWHTEHLGYLLAEMQSLARAHPGATW
ncbi:MAG: ring,2-phenylacetyl-CoA epoxidase subunit PaaC [Frankiaceae bacterium]|nr:ring,2-phenylacetyl-CoA epoxidase subunit PaaC [Frankiaceae bacterium]